MQIIKKEELPIAILDYLICRIRDMILPSKLREICRSRVKAKY